MTTPTTLPPLPTPGGSADTWGEALNAYLTALAALTAQTAVDAASAATNAATSAAAAQQALAGLPDEALRSTPAQIEYDWSGNAYPLRATVTDDPARVVQWRGPTAPPAGNGYAQPAVDEWKIKPAQ